MKTGLHVGARSIVMAVTVALLSNCGALQTPIGAPLTSSYRGATAQRAQSSPKYSIVYGFSYRRHAPHHPFGGVTIVDNTLYGTTNKGGSNQCFDGCGTVYALTPTGTFKLLHKFHGGPKDGHYPVASFTNVDGTLYGVTAAGGAGTGCRDGCGTVFSIGTSGAESLVHSFGGGSADGANPQNSLLDVNGTLYGTTESGGASNDGTIFAISPTGAETVLHSFTGQPYDGASPSSELVDIHGTLYGTTNSGGANDDGTVFSITPSGAEAVVYNFKGGTTDGSGPDSLVGVSGKLFGTTDIGGSASPKHCSSGCGILFSLSTSGTEKVLHSFQHREGAGEKSLIEGGGALYGTARGGSSYRRGTVFTSSLTGVTTVLHAFIYVRGRPDEDGRLPVGQLFFDNETLYGVTQRGGRGNKGTVYALAL